MGNINVVWFKRDLRLTDHSPLHAALTSGRPTLLLYLFEPQLLADEHYDERHWRFVWQSLTDINQTLTAFDTRLVILSMSAQDAFHQIHQAFGIHSVYSHQEIGLNITFQRDRQLKQWFLRQNVTWHESPIGAVIRGASDRYDWDKHWSKIMRAPSLIPISAWAVLLRQKTCSKTTMKYLLRGEQR